MYKSQNELFMPKTKKKKNKKESLKWASNITNSPQIIAIHSNSIG